MVILYLLLVLCLAALVAYPYERVALKRFLTVRKIARLCKERNIKFKVINRAYPFSKNKRNEFDCILRIGKTVIPVKFFSAVDTEATIILDSSGKICIRRAYREPLCRDKKRKDRVIKKYGRLPSMKIGKSIVGDRYTCFPVFLNEPRFASVLKRDEKGNISDFYDGSSKIAGCNFIDSDTLPALISLYTDRDASTK